MYEDAQEIFDFLPLNKTTLEEEYINHLWNAFTTLVVNENTGSSFSIMPFHLLFMLCLQYKILRIYKEKRNKYKLAFTISQIRENEQVSKPSSVFDIALLRERAMIDLLSLIQVKPDLIKNIKELVDNRNDRLAHAKGGIEQNPEKKINEYLNLLKQIQEYMLPLNDRVAKRWLKEMGKGWSGKEYMETHFVEEYLCSADMRQGKLIELDKRLNGEI